MIGDLEMKRTWNGKGLVTWKLKNLGMRRISDLERVINLEINKKLK